MRLVYATGFCGSGVIWAPWIGMHAAHKPRTAFDFRPPTSIPLYGGDPWFMPAVIQNYRMQSPIALWRAWR